MRRGLAGSVRIAPFGARGAVVVVEADEASHLRAGDRFILVASQSTQSMDELFSVVRDRLGPLEVFVQRGESPELVRWPSR